MRADLEIIQEWIPAGSRVLDLGCGDGELLAWLRDHKQVSGYGLEIDPDNIARCIENGVNVIEQDLDKGLGATRRGGRASCAERSWRRL
ncbi:methionine biosynthesis protein MetW, partial [Pseudomonas aeruginosa]|uniref:methionine biosynthesis protein MetW n=1 Tax=Pseudomonas aeruginosa TaxID=287 RepID=UPI003969A298